MLPWRTVDIQGSDEGPTKQPFFSNLQVLPTECRSKEDLNSILLHSGLMLSLEVLQLFSLYNGNNFCY